MKKKRINIKKVIRDVFADFSLLLAAVIFGGLLKINTEKITTSLTEVILLIIIICLLIASAALRNLNQK